jgi:hypothetical protein
MSYITLTPDTLEREHICCAISDKKCVDGVAAKKQWLAGQYEQGYRFRRLDDRGKVFIEYGPGEAAWMPVAAEGWMMMGCFWVSGKFAKSGHGKALLASAMEDAAAQGRAGLVAVVGTKKMHFMSDGKWLLKQGFREVDRLDYGFSLLVKDLDGATAPEPRVLDGCRGGRCDDEAGISVYYSDRCPFAEFHVTTSLKESCEKRGLALHVHKLDSLEAARAAPSPATIFSLFKDGRFVTTDLSACMDSRFDKVVM